MVRDEELRGEEKSIIWDLTEKQDLIPFVHRNGADEGIGCLISGELMNGKVRLYPGNMFAPPGQGGLDFNAGKVYDSLDALLADWRID